MKALITGITGQDGSWMADLLVDEGYEVHGLVRRQSDPAYRNIQHLLRDDAVVLHEGDLADATSIDRVFSEVQPDEVYQFAAQSHVGSSFRQPEYTFDVTGFGALRVYQSVERHCPEARVYQASSSEMFGKTAEPGKKLTLNHPFQPVSPYGQAKVMAHAWADYYRTYKDLHICCGVLFNHESSRRGERFVTRKISRAVARISHGLQDSLELGNLDAVRDWGHAPEYVEAAYKLLQLDEPRDVVVCTGEGYSVREFLEAAWTAASIPLDRLDAVVTIHEEHKRPTDIDYLVGDPSHAQEVLGWEAETGFDDLVRFMVQADVDRVRKEGD